MSPTVRITGDDIETEELDVLHHDGLQVRRWKEILPNGQIEYYEPDFAVEGYPFAASHYDAVSRDIAEEVRNEEAIDLHSRDDIRVVNLDSDNVEVL